MTTRLVNPFTPAIAVEPKVKLLAFGDTGTGKTREGLSFPGPIAVIDTEASTALYAGRDWASEFHRLTTKTYDEARDAIAFLATGQHDFKTVMVDPVTTFWDVLQEAQAVNRERRSGVDADFNRLDWNKVKRAYKALLNDLVTLDMHVVVTARESILYAGEGNNLRAIGYKPDAEKGTGYYFDTVIRLTLDERGRRTTYFYKDRSTDGRTGTTIEGVPPFVELFADFLKGKGTAKRTVPSEEAAAKATAGSSALNEVEPAGPQLASRVVEALEAIDQDPDAVLASQKWSTFADAPKAKVEALLARAEAKARENGTDAPSDDDAAGTTTDTSASEDDGSVDPSGAGDVSDSDDEDVTRDEPTPIARQRRSRKAS